MNQLHADAFVQVTRPIGTIPTRFCSASGVQSAAKTSWRLVWSLTMSALSGLCRKRQDKSECWRAGHPTLLQVSRPMYRVGCQNGWPSRFGLCFRNFHSLGQPHGGCGGLPTSVEGLLIWFVSSKFPLEYAMATLGLIEYKDASPEVRAVYDDIMATRKSDWVNNFWKAMAHDPATLKRTWEDIKQIMAPGALDPLTKEMVYLAVSVSNQCGYCIASHTAGARNKGMTDAMFKELMAVVGMANETNRVVAGYQVEIDEQFKTADSGL